MEQSATLKAQLRDVGPWYRQPWPWLLMLGPFVVVVAGFITLYLAISSNDGLVGADYYSAGLKANKTLAASAQADQLGLIARLRLTEDSVSLNLKAERASDYVLPGIIRLTLSHPTRAGMDQEVELHQLSNGSYQGSLRLPRSGHWLVLLGDPQQSWRLLGEAMLPANGEIVVSGQGKKGAAVTSKVVSP